MVVILWYQPPDVLMGTLQIYTTVVIPALRLLGVIMFDTAIFDCTELPMEISFSFANNKCSKVN